MKNKNDLYLDLKYRKLSQLGFSLIFALFLFLIPVAAGTNLHLSLQLSPQTVDLSLPLGAALVHATGGLTITKSAPAFVGQGGEITYTLRITNNTGQDLTDIQVVDTLPNDVDPSFCQAVGLPANWAFGCQDGTSAVWAFIGGAAQPFSDGTAVNLRFKVRASSPLTNGHPIVNDDYQVLAESNSFIDAGPAVTTTITAPQWAITKTVSSSTIKPGQNLVYTITATNVGPVSTTGAYTITDDLPNDTTLVSPASLSWSFTTPLAPSASRTVNYTVQVNSPLPDGLKIVNDGYTVSGGGAAAPAVNEPITVTVNSPSTLSITKVASADPVIVGQTLRYTLTLTNNATTGPAVGVVITDILPSEFTFQSATPGGVHSNGVVVWTSPYSLSPGVSTQVVVSGSVTTVLPQPPVITNSYQASASNAVPVFGETTVEVEPGSLAGINLAVSPASISLCATTTATATAVDGFGNPIPGVPVNMFHTGQLTPPSPITGTTNAAGEFAVSFQGTNGGTVNMGAFSGNFSDIASLTVNPPAVPSSLTVSASPSPLVTGGNTAVVTATVRDCQNQAVSGQSVSFTLSNPALASFSGPTSGTTNGSGVVTTTLTSNSIPLAGTLNITGTSGNLVGVTSLDVLPPNTPLLTLTKQANPSSGSTVETGQTLVYTVTIANNGTGGASGVVITDDLAAGVNFAGGSITNGTGPFVAGNRITFSIANLGIGSSSRATISVTVTSAVSGTILNNSARARSNSTAPVSSNVVTHTVITQTVTPAYRLYLPLVVKE